MVWQWCGHSGYSWSRVSCNTSCFHLWPMFSDLPALHVVDVRGNCQLSHTRATHATHATHAIVSCHPVGTLGHCGMGTMTFMTHDSRTCELLHAVYSCCESISGSLSLPPLSLAFVLLQACKHCRCHDKQVKQFSDIAPPIAVCRSQLAGSITVRRHSTDATQKTHTIPWLRTRWVGG